MHWLLNLTLEVVKVLINLLDLLCLTTLIMLFLSLSSDFIDFILYFFFESMNILFDCEIQLLRFLNSYFNYSAIYLELVFYLRFDLIHLLLLVIGHRSYANPMRRGVSCWVRHCQLLTLHLPQNWSHWILC